METGYSIDAHGVITHHRRGDEGYYAPTGAIYWNEDPTGYSIKDGKICDEYGRPTEYEVIQSGAILGPDKNPPFIGAQNNRRTAHKP